MWHSWRGGNSAEVLSRYWAPRVAAARPAGPCASGCRSAMSVRRVHSALALLALAAAAHALIDDALDVIRLSKEIGEEVLNSWDVIGRPFNVTGGVELPLVRRREREVLARLAQVSRTIERLELRMERLGSVAMLLAKTGSRGARLELRLHEMADLLSRVASANRQMREYVRLQQELERATLENFAEWCVSHDSGGLPSLLERVHSLISPPHKHLLGRSILDLVLEDLKVGTEPFGTLTYKVRPRKYSRCKTVKCRKHRLPATANSPNTNENVR
ncbi:unnamed protein product, partial [Iphiclides podalirius]